jgi:hypothetical protein
MICRAPSCAQQQLSKNSTAWLSAGKSAEASAESQAVLFQGEDFHDQFET